MTRRRTPSAAPHPSPSLRRPGWPRTRSARQASKAFLYWSSTRVGFNLAATSRPARVSSLQDRVGLSFFTAMIPASIIWTTRKSPHPRATQRGCFSAREKGWPQPAPGAVRCFRNPLIPGDLATRSKFSADFASGSKIIFETGAQTVPGEAGGALLWFAGRRDRPRHATRSPQSWGTRGPRCRFSVSPASTGRDTSRRWAPRWGPCPCLPRMAGVSSHPVYTRSTFSGHRPRLRFRIVSFPAGAPLCYPL